MYHRNNEIVENFGHLIRFVKTEEYETDSCGCINCDKCSLYYFECFEIINLLQFKNIRTKGLSIKYY